MASLETTKADRLRVAEIFASIQGEGKWLGTPSVFVRVSGCNLRCNWCDTPYASWEPEGPTMQVSRIVDKVAEFGLRHVVLTGGEPMLFEPIVKLANDLQATGSIVTIETAGTVFRDLACDLMSISPKLLSSAPDEASGWRGRHNETRTNLDALARLITSYPHQLKFVVNPETGLSDIVEIEALLVRLPPVRREHILLMPEGRDAGVLARRGKLLVPTCLAKGWRLTPRYQIDLFGNSRGT